MSLKSVINKIKELLKPTCPIEYTDADNDLLHGSLLRLIGLLEHENDREARNLERHKKRNLFGSVSPAYQLMIDANDKHLKEINILLNKMDQHLSINKLSYIIYNSESDQRFNELLKRKR